MLIATVFGFALGLYANDTQSVLALTFIGFLFGCAFLIIPILDIILFRKLKRMEPTTRNFGVILQTITFALNATQLVWFKSFQPFVALQLLGAIILLALSFTSTFKAAFQKL